MIVQVCLTQKRGRLQYGYVRIPYLFLFLNACISYSRDIFISTFKWSLFPVYTSGSIRPQQLIE